MEDMWTQRLVISKSGKLINNDGLRVYRPNVIKSNYDDSTHCKRKVMKFNNSNWISYCILWVITQVIESSLHTRILLKIEIISML